MIAHYTTSESLFLGLDKHQRKIASASVERILGYLRSLGSFGQRFYVSLRRIARRTRLTLKTVHKWIRRMVAVGTIRIPMKGQNNKRGASGVANVYSVGSRVIHSSSITPKREKLIKDESSGVLCNQRLQCQSALSFGSTVQSKNESEVRHCNSTPRGLDDLEDLEECHENHASFAAEFERRLRKLIRDTRDNHKGNQFLRELEQQYEATKDAPYHPTIKRLLDSGMTLDQVKDYCSDWEHLRWMPTPTKDKRPRCCRCNSLFRLKVNLQTWTESYGQVFYGCPKCRMVRPLFWESKKYEYAKVYCGT